MQPPEKQNQMVMKDRLVVSDQCGCAAWCTCIPWRDEQRQKGGGEAKERVGEIKEKELDMRAWGLLERIII